MQNVIEITMDDNTKLYIETYNQKILGDEDSLCVPASSGEKAIKKAQSFLDNSLAQIKTFSNSIAESIKKSDIQPDDFELEFAVKIAADVGIVISSVSTEANITIKMKWSKPKEV